MPTESSPIKFGILGCAAIARKVSRAITLAPNAVLYAIGSRSIDKAEQFAASNGFPPNAKVYGSYDAVLDDADVDAVYMPLPTSLHIKWAVLAAEKKKHILLEKPVALNVRDLDAILQACESNGVQYMDGSMYMHHPRMEKMKAFISDPNLFGVVKYVHSNFTFAADQNFLENNIRVKPDLDALGALGDVGWYCARSILWAYDYNLPQTVVALRGAILNKDGVIISCGASLHWDNGQVATFHCSFLGSLTMDVTVIGSKGTLHMNDFVQPFVEYEAPYTAASGAGFDELAGCWDPVPTVGKVEHSCPQEALMVKEFSRLVSEGKIERKWSVLSRKTQLVVDAVKASIDKGFEAVQILA